ncbi:MAG: hypothetical protein KKA19_02990 [Candidatus Margulisbacteria bacterium]|nr:hypothetical protein [Candidatus Margulisiibacteriota bacterium]
MKNEEKWVCDCGTRWSENVESCEFCEEEELRSEICRVCKQISFTGVICSDCVEAEKNKCWEEYDEIFISSLTDEEKDAQAELDQLKLA